MLRRKAHEQARRQRAVVEAIRKYSATEPVRQFSRRLSGLEAVSKNSQQMENLLERLKRSEAIKGQENSV